MASLLYSNWRKIVRLYEGYPIKRIFSKVFPGTGQFARWRQMPGVAWHVRQQGKADPGELYERYFADKHVENTLPTTIGNILLSSELYALDRYGLDVNLLWPRLYWQLPDEVRRDMEIFKEEHQVPIALSFVSALFAVTAGITTFVLRSSWLVFTLATSIGLALAYASYRLAIERTEEYAEQLRTTVDLYRRLLLDNWRLGPKSFEDEKTILRISVAVHSIGEGPTVWVTRSEHNKRSSASLGGLGGPLALVRTGDLVELDVPGRKLTLKVSNEELAKRREVWKPKARKYERGYGRIFSQHVSQADKGCDFDFLEGTAPIPDPEIH